MSDASGTRRAIPVSVLQHLAELLDQFENSDDPCLKEVRDAERLFNAELERLYMDFVLSQEIRLSLAEFRGHVVLRCKQWLASERRKPPTIPPH